MILLGISVGTRTSGLCVLEHGDIIDANLHVYHAPWSPTKLHIMLKHYEQYIRKYNVIAVMLKLPPEEKHSNETKLIMKKVRKMADKLHCQFDYTTNLELRSTYELEFNEGIPAKTKELFPELAASETPHYARFFEAILTAHLYQERLKKKALLNN